MMIILITGRKNNQKAQFKFQYCFLIAVCLDLIINLSNL